MTEDRQKKFTIARLAQIAGARLIGNPKTEVSGVASFESAGPDCITFAADQELLKEISGIRTP